MSVRIITALCTCLCLSLNVSAETVYVNDQLRVGVRTEPNNNVAPIGVVITGMQLEVLDRRSGFIRIRTPDGVEGWISDSYVTSDKPAVLVVEDLQEQNRKLSESLAQRDKLIKSAETTAAQLSSESGRLEDANAQLRLQLLEAKQSSAEPGLSPYAWVAIVGVLMALVGFAVGVIWHRRLAMRRLGGLRV